MIKTRYALATALIFGTSALAQTPDPHAGHTMPAPAAAPAPMDHAAMGHGAMAPAPGGIVRHTIGPAEAALQGFSDALAVGNRDLAIERLGADAKIIEDGIEESRAGYISGHLASDIAFQKTVNAILVERVVIDESPSRVLIVSKVRMVGNRRDKAIDATVSETAIIGKTADGWKIERLEWAKAQ